MTPRERAEAFVASIFGVHARKRELVQQAEQVIWAAERAARAQERERCAGIVYRWSPASANTDAWLRERDLVIGEIQAGGDDVTAPKKLDDKGRCCGRKPLVYKVPQHRLFCARCDAQYDPQTGIQVANWAYRAAADGFAKVYANAKAPEETT